MIVHGIAFLASITSRTHMYLQSLIENDLLPENCIVYVEKNIIESTKDEVQSKDCHLYESIMDLLKKHNINYRLVLEKDINSDIICNIISEMPQKFFIYSGYGGYILKPHLFSLGKQFLHVHAGILPEYRGSTTAYYSILQDSYIGATSIFLNEKIDQGDIIYQEKFPMPSNKENIDYVYEPWVRSQVLVKTLKSYIANKGFSLRMQNNDKAETYFIIHPVLKHLALLKVENFRRLKADEKNIIYPESAEKK